MEKISVNTDFSYKKIYFDVNGFHSMRIVYLKCLLLSPSIAWDGSSDLEKSLKSKVNLAF